MSACLSVSAWLSLSVWLSFVRLYVSIFFVFQLRWLSEDGGKETDADPIKVKSSIFFVFQLRWQSEDGGEETPTTFAPEIHRAAESVRFIAQRIVSKDSYNQVR